MSIPSGTDNVSRREAVESRAPIEELADDYLARRRSGGCPSITEYAADNPELAEEIWELFPTLVMLEDMGPGREDTLAVGLPPNLGEYRIGARDWSWWHGDRFGSGARDIAGGAWL